MGLSASQARLLSITARLSSNEYESQQISNAKMRLATQSEEASQDYINALNSTQLNFLTYNAQGDATTTNLTANVLFQYADMKNQYSIVNSSGQVLISNEDAKNFENSKNLDEFLGCYGIKKIYKSEELEQAYEKITSKEAKEVYSKWENLVKEVMQANWSVSYVSNVENTETHMNTIYKNKQNVSAEEAYRYQKSGAYLYFTNVDTNYKAAVLSGESVTTNNWAELYGDAKQLIADCTTFQTWCNAMARALAAGEIYDLREYGYGYATESALKETKADGTLGWIEGFGKNENDELIFNNKSVDSPKPIKIILNDKEKNLLDEVEKYYENLAEFEAIAKDAGCTTLAETYTYDDPVKAQWYTNLWYRLNGESSEKSKQGELATNYQVLDSKLAESPDWLQNSLKQGIVTLEIASNEDVNDVLESDFDLLSDTLSFNIKGVNWTSKVYTSATDLTVVENEAEIAKATAEYERKTQEINIKDQKYQNRIKLLDTEHNTLQAQYDSIKSAISENIKRSYSSFSG